MNFQIKHLVNFPELQEEFQTLIDNNWDTIGTLDDVGWNHWFDFIEKNPEYQFGVYIDENSQFDPFCCFVISLSSIYSFFCDSNIFE